MEFRDLKKQYQALKPAIDEAVLGVMAECNFISGNQVRELEDRLASYVQTKHCISCANGTDALTLAMAAYKIGEGDAVFVPDFTFFASAEAAAALGATVIFADVDPDTFNLDPASLERAINKVNAEGKLCARMIVSVDLFGLSANYPEIEAIAKKHNLLLLEDGAQGFGGSINGRQVCSFGDIATTSFFPAKPLGCYGDGGAIFTNDDEIASLIRSLTVHGKGTDKYDNVRLGYNSRLDTLQAAILLVKFDAFKTYELNSVNQVAAWYTDRLKGYVKTPVIPAGFTSSWAQYTLQLDNRSQRDNIQKQLKEKGFPSMVYYPKSMHEQTAFSALPRIESCPVAEKLCETVLALPMHPYLTEAEAELIATSVKELLLL